MNWLRSWITKTVDAKINLVCVGLDQVSKMAREAEAISKRLDGAMAAQKQEMKQEIKTLRDQYVYSWKERIVELANERTAIRNAINAMGKSLQEKDASLEVEIRQLWKCWQSRGIEKPPKPVAPTSRYPFLSLDEVSERLGVHPKTIRRMYAKGLFPKPFRVGNQLRWDESTIQTWYEEKRHA